MTSSEWLIGVDVGGTFTDAVVMAGGQVEEVPTAMIRDVVDTTGAGDLFASGFLFGLTQGLDLRACAQLGNRCAGRIIQHVGARSLEPLTNLLAA